MRKTPMVALAFMMACNCLAQGRGGGRIGGHGGAGGGGFRGGFGGRGYGGGYAGRGFRGGFGGFRGRGGFGRPFFRGRFGFGFGGPYWWPGPYYGWYGSPYSSYYPCDEYSPYGCAPVDEGWYGDEPSDRPASARVITFSNGLGSAAFIGDGRWRHFGETASGNKPAHPGGEVSDPSSSLPTARAALVDDGRWHHFGENR